MNIFEILIIAVGVSMDAFAVSICKGLSVRKVSVKHMLLTGLWFGGFQALMPLLGYFAGIHFADFVSGVDHWISFLLLGYIGFNMIREAISDEEEDINPDFSFRTMFAMAVATSIDALAVGVSLAFLKVDIWTAVLLIGIITAAFSMAGVWIGNIFGSRYKKASEIAGGLILIFMGVNILLQHILG